MPEQKRTEQIARFVRDGAPHVSENTPFFTKNAVVKPQGAFSLCATQTLLTRKYYAHDVNRDLKKARLQKKQKQKYITEEKSNEKQQKERFYSR